MTYSTQLQEHFDHELFAKDDDIRERYAGSAIPLDDSLDSYYADMEEASALIKDSGSPYKYDKYAPVVPLAVEDFDPDDECPF